MLRIKFLYVIIPAVLEAEDIDLYLCPLRRVISNLEEMSFPKVVDVLPALFHTLCLIWSHSRYYCTAPRMVVLLQEFCNLIIEKVLRCRGKNIITNRQHRKPLMAICLYIFPGFCLPHS